MGNNKIEYIIRIGPFDRYLKTNWESYKKRFLEGMYDE
jgi:hypothetical protein